MTAANQNRGRELPDIQLVTRSYPRMIGLARYTISLVQALDDAGLRYETAQPACPWPIRAAHRMMAPLGFDVQTFFTTYPVTASPQRRGRLTHLTTQQMATLLWFQPHLHPAVITVHDIVPYLVRSDPGQSTFRHPLDRLFDDLSARGLRRADAIIAISGFTRQTLIETLGCPADKITVIPLGVRHDLFHPLEPGANFYARFHLDPSLRYLLYVGSENPRKNLPRLIQAFDLVHRQFPETRLVKIGTPEYIPQAQALREQVRQMRLEEAVIFVEHISDEDLARFYNAAALFIFPSLLEGFGLPPLEAMACGAPVVCSGAASLPEVVGDAALLVDPESVEEMAAAMVRVLCSPRLSESMRAKGLARAAEFTWERCARETVAVYQKFMGR